LPALPFDLREPCQLNCDTSSARLATADSRDVFRAVSENERRARPGSRVGARMVRDAVIDIATPVCIRQTTPALVKERARVLRCRRARLAREAGVSTDERLTLA
jgi:hypothetical protein